MAELDLQGKLDAAPLVASLLQKSRAGKLSWEPTADRRAFVTSVAGQLTFKLYMATTTDVGAYGQLENVEVPRLDMLDEKGKVLWDIGQKDVKGLNLSELYETARRIANRLDEKVATVMSALDKL
jgi:hypothetical protein